MHATLSALAALAALAVTAALEAQAFAGLRREQAHDSVLSPVPEAPRTHTLDLAHHPSPNHLTSHIRQRRRAARQQQSAKQQGESTSLSPRRDERTETMNTAISGVYPLINITWPGHGGDQVLQHYVDTGSSDTFAIQAGFECRSTKTHKHVRPEHCRWGTPYDLHKGDYTPIPGEDFDISYFPEQEHLHGTVGWTPLKVAGVSLAQAKVAMVNRSLYLGDGHSSGLLGLAYPALTNAFKSSGAHDMYDPVFTAMVKQGAVSHPMFSLAINRVPKNSDTGIPAGTLALGGMVPSSLYDGPLTTVPIEETKSQPGNLSLYSLSHTLSWRPANKHGKESWTHYSSAHSHSGSQSARSGQTNKHKRDKSNKKKKTTYQSIVDSGTSAVFVPTSAARAINALFDPPAQPYGKDKEYWTVPCNATPPDVSFGFGRKHWRMDKRDMIVKQLTALPDARDVCFSSVADGGDPQDDALILGAVWQRSVVVGYDMEKDQLHFAPRKPY